MSTATDTRRLRLPVPERHRFRELQALEDAVNYRLARLMAPCPLCHPGPDGRCDEHACDVALIAGYLEAAQATMAELSRADTERRAAREEMARGGGDRHGA